MAEYGLGRANAVCFLDWDDTLMFTSQVMRNARPPQGAIAEEEMGPEEKGLEEKLEEKLQTLDGVVSRSLRKFASQCMVVIVTNAEEVWVKESCETYFPKVKRMIDLCSISIVSASDAYFSKLPNEPAEWKALTFQKILYEKLESKENHINVVVVGDDIVDMRAAERLMELVPNAIVKSVKFLENPSVDELLRQISLLNIHFARLFSHKQPISVSLLDAISSRT
eukprot:Plantae.Rhodophyta-Purpureofilum_apyrenoidigerum.ctg56156.p2 GENE.Plantae.Rhodophyta-Purpureofilum_apyrenoidigerum.ctg56156~~Plantae.Rhodophyta-Purpureofilum_apyrenoidigerum.ctg56156.p2  ORF type:complete len:244 (-),score=62.85 Plantae.Rhodophyta-Purpureofilum_apyrenoidigerum.ctg56156:1297-1968(-)